jgi:hypothetical protein
MLRYLMTIALFAHGIGHLLFLTNSWGIWKGGNEGRSWLFSGMLGAGQTVEGIFGLLWLIPLLGFVAVSWGYLTHQGWWPQLALASAAISLAMIVVGWSRCGERLLRARFRSGRHRRGALATAVGGGYLMRGDRL